MSTCTHKSRPESASEGDVYFCCECGDRYFSAWNIEGRGVSWVPLVRCIGCTREAGNTVFHEGEECVEPVVHPIGLSWWKGGDVEMVRCPACGKVDEVQCFDVGGADEGCVFCNSCGQEFFH